MVTMTDDCPFITIALPKEIVDHIDIFIKDSDYLFTSRAHVVKVALSRFFNNNKNGGGCYGEMERKNSFVKSGCSER